MKLAGRPRLRVCPIMIGSSPGRLGNGSGNCKTASESAAKLAPGPSSLEAAGAARLTATATGRQLTKPDDSLAQASGWRRGRRPGPQR